MKEKKIKLLMLSSTGLIGGGPKNMFLIGEGLSNKFNVYYSLPKSNYFKSKIRNEIINIEERKISISDLINILGFLRFNDIDIIHAHGKGASVICRIVALLTRKPLIYTFHGIHISCHSKFKKYLYFFYEFLFGRVDQKKIFVSLSEKIYAKKSKLYIGKNNLIINNGVRNKKMKIYFDNDEINKKIEVVSVCRLVDQKNILEIIKIGQFLKNINFRIVGDGPLFSKLSYFIEKNNIRNITLLGSRKDVFQFLYNSDIFLTSSLYEGLPISVLEAMSVGLPVVASNVIGNSDAVSHDVSGFLYELNNIKEAAEYINILSESQSIRKKMGRKSYERQREKFSVNQMISSYEKLYEETYLKNNSL